MSEHRTLFPFCQVTYWTGYTATSDDEAWDRCKVSPRGMYSYGEQEFPNTPEGRSRRDALISFLAQAYEHGRSDMKREIREVLGVKEPRG